MKVFFNSIVLWICITGFYACGSQSDKEEAGSEVKNSAAPVKETRPATSFIYDFNAIEQVFGNDNWLIADKKDSSYFYASRLGDFVVNSYEYRLKQGDTAEVKHGSMKADTAEVIWTFQNRKLAVTSAANATMACRVAGADSMKYEFKRVDRSSIQVTYPDGKKLVWKKTIPFSLFVVRSRYDYAHGTHYAFDTTDFTKRHK